MFNWHTIVGERANHLHDQTTSPDSVSTTTDTEVGVFPKKTGILLVNANDILDDECRAVVLYKRTRLQNGLVTQPDIKR